MNGDGAVVGAKTKMADASIESHEPIAIRFLDFELTLHPLALSKSGQPVELSTQPLKLLSLLVAQQGGLVSHADIREKLWEDRTVDFGRSIHVCIRQIRTALNDDASAARFIKNVPRQGYQFLPPVEFVFNSTRTHPAPTSPQSLHRVIVAAGLSIFFMLAAVATFVSSGDTGRVHVESDERKAALDSYQRGIYLLDQREAVATDKSIQYFNAALAANPDLAEAHIGAARAFGRLGRFEEANQRARRALSLDNNLADAYVVLGLIDLIHNWEWRTALLNLQAALDRDPNNASAHQGIAIYYALQGNLEAAISHMGLAREFDPASTIIRADFGWFYYFAGDYSSAAKVCKEALDLEPSNFEHRHCLIRARSLAGEHSLALEQMVSYMRDKEAAENEIDAIFSTAAKDQLLMFDKWRLRLAVKEPQSSASQAFAAAAAHDFERALVYAKRALDQRDPMIPFIAVDPVFTPLLRDDNYQELLRQLDLSQEITDS